MEKKITNKIKDKKTVQNYKNNEIQLQKTIQKHIKHIQIKHENNKNVWKTHVITSNVQPYITNIRNTNKTTKKNEEKQNKTSTHMNTYKKKTYKNIWKT